MDIDKKLEGIQLVAQEKLQAIICSIPGKKDLIIESSLIKPLEHVCSASWLKLKGIIKIFKYEPTAIARTEDRVQLYLIPSDLNIFERVLKHIHEIETQQPTDTSIAIKFYHIICVPTCFSYFQKLLEEDGLYGMVQLHRYSWDFINLDRDLLSLETPKVFSNVFMKEDTSLLPSVAQSLRLIERLCGKPDMLITYGQHSENLLKMFTKMMKNNENFDISKPTDLNNNDFDLMILIDRDKDYASPLLTPSIYAGLLLEIFSAKAGEIDIELDDKVSPQKLNIFRISLPKKLPSDASINKNSSKTLNRKQNIIKMNSMCDEIYGENRYKHFSQTSSLVRNQAKAIGMEVHKLNNMKLEEMHDYVARKLPKITELKAKVLRHLNASEKVIDILGGNYRKVLSLEEDILNNVNRKRLFTEINDELLTTDGHRFNTLRLLCLLHLCCGLSNTEIHTFAHNYCNYFGTKNLLVFDLLEKAGLLPNLLDEEMKLNKSASKLLSNIPIPKFQQTSFQANANRLKLMVGIPETDAEEAKNHTKNSCPSFVFNGLYIPLVSQLCAILLKVTSSEELLSKLGMIEGLSFYKKPLYQMSTIKNISNQMNNTKDLFPLKKRNIFVYIVGGVTYAEIGACEMISRLTNSKIVITSDCVTSGSDLISGAFS